MRLQLRQRHRVVDRRAVVEHAEIAPVKVDDLAAGGVQDECVPDCPFLRHDPVEQRRPGGNVPLFERQVPAEYGERIADALPGDAAADREDRLCQFVQLGADVAIDIRARSAG